MPRTISEYRCEKALLDIATRDLIGTSRQGSVKELPYLGAWESAEGASLPWKRLKL